MKVAIIDYNAGNIQSVSYALERLDIEHEVTDNAEVITSADKVIFPGVGEASTTMNHLKIMGLNRLIKDLRQPVLGICLGMQLMCRHSEEGNVDCLGIFEVDVNRFDNNFNPDFKIPHMGWNQLQNIQDSWIPKELNGEHVYFVHSYFVPVNENTMAKTDYITPFSAAIQKNNFYAVQFHPEKSAAAGQKILKAFLNIES